MAIRTDDDETHYQTHESQQSQYKKIKLEENLEATLEEAQKARKPSYKAHYKTAVRKEASQIFQ